MTPPTTTLRDRGQLTLPAEIRAAVHLEPGTILELRVEAGRIIMTPKALVDSEQAWFWTERWQSMEQQADADFGAGRSVVFEDLDGFLEDLDA